MKLSARVRLKIKKNKIKKLYKFIKCPLPLNMMNF